MSHIDTLFNTRFSRREFLQSSAVLATASWRFAQNIASIEEVNNLELEASYDYSFELVTVENKESKYSEYELGENVATISILKNGQPANFSIRASVGMNWLLGKMGDNSINESWFPNGIFDKDSFTEHVANPIFQSIGGFIEDVSTTVSIVNLSPGISGETNNYSSCAEQKYASLKLDTEFINNPSSSEWEALSEEQKALLDRAVISTPAHEALHIKLASLGVPPNVVGEEALASAFARYTLNKNRFLWHSENSDRIIKDNSHAPFFDNSNLKMQGTGINISAGYEHDMLIEWLLESKGKDWQWLLSRMDQVTHEEQEIGCPVVQYVNVLSRVFSETPWQNTLGHYLGETLKPEGSEYNDTFYLVRPKVDENMTQIAYNTPINLQPDFFSYYKYIHLDSGKQNEHPIFSCPDGVKVSVLDQNDTVHVLENGANLSPYIIRNARGKTVRMVVYNPLQQEISAQIRPVVFDKKIYAPSIVNK